MSNDNSSYCEVSIFPSYYLEAFNTIKGEVDPDLRLELAERHLLTVLGKVNHEMNLLNSAATVHLNGNLQSAVWAGMGHLRENPDVDNFTLYGLAYPLECFMAVRVLGRARKELGISF